MVTNLIQTITTLSFILSSFFILTLHVQVRWLVLDTCPIHPLLKSLGVAVRL